ncbi:MAG TPA: hypothetical protein VFC63_09265 [Blastocatellia bacterium]|nr:hypothetical protein [Blastocatellia bacterium]
MSIEYAIEYSCGPRRRYGEKQLRVLGRKANLHARVIAGSLEENRTPTKESVDFVTNLESDMQTVEEVAKSCRECPASLGYSGDEFGRMASTKIAPEPIGCLGRINFPVDAVFEQFLANRIQLLLDTVNPEQWPRLLTVLVDPESPFDGEATKDLRPVTSDTGLRFFEMRVPIKLNRNGSRLSMDNVFDLLAGFTNTDNGASGYHRELPNLALADYSEFLETILRMDMSEGEHARLAEKSRSFVQYLRLADAIDRALQLGGRLLLD